jgi:hypothetical protein
MRYEIQQKLHRSLVRQDEDYIKRLGDNNHLLDHLEAEIHPSFFLDGRPSTEMQVTERKIWEI